MEQVSKQQAKLITGGESEDVLSWLVELIRRDVGVAGLRGLSIGCAAAAAPEIAFARSAAGKGMGVIIAGAGHAAHLAGAMAALFMLAMQVSNLSALGDEDGYTVKASFQNIGGLKVRAPVTVAGAVGA